MGVDWGEEGLIGGRWVNWGGGGVDQGEREGID